MINPNSAHDAGSEVHVATFVQTLGQLFYYQLSLIQAVDKRLARNSIAGTDRQQPTSGYPICDVGIVNALDAARDPVFSVNRAHVHGFIRADDVGRFIGSAMTDERRSLNGPESFRPSGSATLCNTNCNEEQLIVSTLQAAVASKECKSGAVSVAFLGDTPTARRHVIHGLHAARWWSLPILFVINHATPSSVRQYGPQLTTDQPEQSFDGHLSSLRSIVADDVFKVYAFASAAIAYVRNTARPFLLHLEPPYSDGSLTSHAESSAEKGSSSVHDALWKVAQKLSPLEQRNIDAFVARRIESVLQSTN